MGVRGNEESKMTLKGEHWVGKDVDSTGDPVEEKWVGN